MEKADANSLQVRVELPADCLAGVWANHAQAKWQFIEPGDVEAAPRTASAIGDDRLETTKPRLRRAGRVYPWYLQHSAPVGS